MMAERKGADGTPRRQREHLSPQIAKQLREMIITGQLRAGERLRAEQLADALGVSATPVREALMSMTGEGMVDFQPGRGFRVVPLTRRDVLDVYDMQAYVSGRLAELAVPNLTDGDLTTLDNYQEKLKEAVSADNADLIEEMDFETHRLINRAANAPKLAWMLGLTLRYVPFGAHAQIPGWPVAARDDHVSIMRALKMRSPVATRDYMQAHIHHAGDLLVGMLAERGVLED
jgi:DNA-binding GntR family transcriptional regulator